MFFAWNSNMFGCDLILNFHDLLIVGDLVDLLFICLLLFFHEYFIQFIHDLFIISAYFFLCIFFEISSSDKLIRLLWVDSVVQMSGWIEICPPLVWFSRINYCVTFILWIRVSVLLQINEIHNE
ncbi:hypothetical protein AMTRI_Chr07g25570 [Amborella trichopoda]